MEEEKTVFAKILDGEIPCKKAYEDDWVLAFHDIAPAAPVHLLIIPKKPIRDIQSVQKEDFIYIEKIFSAAQQLATEYGVEHGYRLLTNNGSDAGQTVFHLHFHLIGGRKLGVLA